MTTNTHQHLNIVKDSPDFGERGMLFMADISGFTKFVRDTDFEFGKNVIQELLSSILEGNTLNMEVLEIEGDAVLFYRFGTPPSVYEIVDQFKKMSSLFYHKLNQFDTAETIELSLKFMVHYGKLGRYQVGTFTKLYGQSVIEIHRLLKNSIDSNHYLLMTDEYLKATNNVSKNCMEEFKVCEMYTDVGMICYTYIPYHLTTTINTAAMA